MPRMTKGITIECTLHIVRERKGRKNLQPGEDTAKPRIGRIPRVAKLMALAIRFEQLVREGLVADYAELSRLGRITRARMTQIMNLANLAPDIQEDLLFLPRVTHGRDPVTERDLRAIAAVRDWGKQRRMRKGISD
jgi:hypothetical protein